MALARLALRNLSQRLGSSSVSPLVGHGGVERSVDGGVQRLRWNEELLKRFMATAGDASDAKQVAVNENNHKSRQLSRKKGKRGLWRRTGGEFVPQLYDFFPSGLGNALLQATENINKLFDNLNLSPSNLMGQLKEKDECYMLRYEVPGLSKEDMKITVDDGVLTIRGEHKEEEGVGGTDEDENWSTRSYGFYNTSVLLPDDAKADDIKAELKNGVLVITVPRTGQPKKDVKEVQIQ